MLGDAGDGIPCGLAIEECMLEGQDRIVWLALLYGTAYLFHTFLAGLWTDGLQIFLNSLREFCLSGST